jgi:hypothetical protein
MAQESQSKSCPKIKSEETVNFEFRAFQARLARWREDHFPALTKIPMPSGPSKLNF